METIDIIHKLGISYPHIECFYLNSYPKQLLLQERIVLSEKENLLLEKALNMKRQYQMPFWDGMMLSAFDNPDFSENIFDAALIHRRCDEMIPVYNNEKLLDNLQQFRNGQIGWISMVKLSNGEYVHFPIFDFHIPVSSLNQNIVKRVSIKLGIKNGAIINSGESYHVIGYEYINYATYHDMLIKALFFSPIIDRLWVAHQLLNQSATLRIGKKNGFYPLVVELINGKG